MQNSFNKDNKTKEEVTITKPKEEPRNLLFDAVSFASMQELSELSMTHFDRGYKAVIDITFVGEDEEVEE